MLALLVGRALRRNELAEFELETIQQREGRWVLTDLEGKGRRICDNPTQILAGVEKSYWSSIVFVQAGAIAASFRSVLIFLMTVSPFAPRR